MKRKIISSLVFFSLLAGVFLNAARSQAQAPDPSVYMTPDQQAAVEKLKPNQSGTLKRMSMLMSRCRPVKNVKRTWNSFVRSLKGFEEKEIQAIFQSVLMQVSMEHNSHLQEYSMKVANYDTLKNQIRDEIKLVRDAVNRMDVHDEPADLRKKTFKISRGNDFLVKESKTITTREQLNEYVKELQDRLKEVDTEQEQAKVEMQEKVQEQQTAMESYSNLFSLSTDGVHNRIRGVR